MAFRLTIEEDPATEVRRCAVEQLDEAIHHLESGRDDDPVEAIHDARKNIKRTRSLLRLVRSDLRERTYRERNRALRDIARALSGTRDAQVMVQTLQALSERYIGQVPATTFARLEETLAEEALSAHDTLSESINEQIQALRDLRDGVDGWPLRGVRRRSLRRGLEQTHASGRAAYRLVRRRPSVDALHEWRKTVKDLDYQQRLLRELWPAVMAALAEEAHRLSDLLGDDHDLAVLHATLHDDDGLESRVPADTDPVLALIEHRRGELQAEARALGKRLYADTPRSFSRRLRRLGRAARDEAAAHELPALVLPPSADGQLREIQMH